MLLSCYVIRVNASCGNQRDDGGGYQCLVNLFVLLAFINCRRWRKVLDTQSGNLGAQQEGKRLGGMQRHEGNSPRLFLEAVFWKSNDH